ncbi:hypothetical protein ACIA8E_32695 [Streptomyces sp. NPDC051664]|uniref:hypothetical protein n=1 Tax=Streptomyces sp. NPDC051664 TaxID=3365668 RepID=UPI003794F190
MDRIAEAEHEDRLGEAQGLSVSLAGAEEKIAHLDAREKRQATPIFPGTPTFDQIVVRTSGTERPSGSSVRAG